MGAVVNLWDRLTNVMTGQGTTVDRRTASRHVFIPMSGEQAEASYRTSWLARKIVDIPPFDMTREWRDWQAESSDIEAIEAEEKRLQLRHKCQRALVLARLYGGGALILGTGDQNTEEELRVDSVRKDGLAYVHVMSMYQLTVGQPRLDPADPWFGQPELFTINGSNGQQSKLHPSRVIPFIGQKAPEGGFHQNVSWYWGDPIMQSIGEALNNADTAQAGFASLIDRAAVDVFKFKDLMSIVGTQEGEDKINKRAAWATQTKSTHRAVLIDTEDEWEQVQASFAGIPDTMHAFLQVVCGAADIPATRLLGQSPRGLQSTGDGEERDYHSMVRARQEEMLGTALDRVDELLIRSALGTRPSDIYYEFAPLFVLSEKDAAEVEKKAGETIKLYADTGLIPDEALSAMAKNRIIESGRWPGSEKAFEEAENVPDEEPDADPAELSTIEERVQEMEKRGTVNADQARAILTDARPRTLYVSRKLLNGDELIRWAKGQGFETTVPADELHVTIAFSRKPVDWMEMGSAWSGDEKGRLKVPPGGARLVERLGDKSAVVLLFSASELSWRHEEMKRNGASHDWDQYQPHVTITYEAPADLDLDAVEPFRGELVFGPEIFEEIVEDWEKSLTER